MANSPVLALELLYDAVVAQFAADAYACAQPFGWRPSAQQHVGRRIVWVPGDPVGGLGLIGPVRNPGGEVRSIGTLFERFHVIISAQDPEQPENERLQYRVTRLLHDAWYRAVYLAAHGTFTIDSEEWITKYKERRFGTALLVVGTIEAMLPDLPPDGESTSDELGDGAQAEIDVTELDNTETLIVAP